MVRRASFLLFFMLMLLIPQTVGASNCGTHVVLRGENLFRISLRYQVNLLTLASVNNISNIHRIYAGQVLHIPCSSTSQASSYTATPTPLMGTPWRPTR